MLILEASGRFRRSDDTSALKHDWVKTSNRQHGGSLYHIYVEKKNFSVYLCTSREGLAGPIGSPLH